MIDLKKNMGAFVFDRQHARAMERACIWRIRDLELAIEGGAVPIAGGLEQAKADIRLMRDCIAEVRKTFGETDE